MRRIKAIYLVPVFLVLLIGAAAASYYFLFKPQLKKLEEAKSAWKTAQEGCRAEEQGYDAALKERVVAATQIFNDHHQFKAIQARMPDITNLKELPVTPPAGETPERYKLRMWYQVMGTGKVIKELTRWARSFHLPNTPTFTYDGIIGYEDTLPSTRLVSVGFGEQQFIVRGYGNLLNAVRRTTGHGYNPVIISLPNDAVTITVDRANPKHDPSRPILTMPYAATAYFFTRGWDPMGEGAKAEVDAAVAIMTSPPRAVPPRGDWADEEKCPPILWFFASGDQQGLEPR